MTQLNAGTQEAIARATKGNGETAYYALLYAHDRTEGIYIPIPNETFDEAIKWDVVLSVEVHPVTKDNIFYAHGKGMNPDDGEECLLIVNHGPEGTGSVQVLKDTAKNVIENAIGVSKRICGHGG